MQVRGGVRMFVRSMKQPPCQEITRNGVHARAKHEAAAVPGYTESKWIALMQ